MSGISSLDFSATLPGRNWDPSVYASGDPLTRMVLKGQVTDPNGGVITAIRMNLSNPMKEGAEDVAYRGRSLDLPPIRDGLNSMLGPFRPDTDSLTQDDRALASDNQASSGTDEMFLQAVQTEASQAAQRMRRAKPARRP